MTGMRRASLTEGPDLTPRDEYACSCCSPALGLMLAANAHIAGFRLGRNGRPAFRTSGASINRRDFVKASSAVLGGLSVGYAASAKAQSSPVRVFRGGTILTVDPSFSTPEAVAIQGDRILAVGPLTKVLEAAGEAPEMVDLDGRTLMPGFIEAHTHALSGAILDKLCINVGMARFRSTAEVLALLQAEAGRAAPGAWILARNWDPSLQAGPAALTFAELDAVSREIPVVVLNSSLHLAYANRAAFAAAGIPDDIENPPGAEFSRDANGQLTGVMKNNVAYLRVLNAYDGLKSADPVDAMVTLAGKFNGLGITTCSDLGLGGITQGAGDWAILKNAAASGRLSMRVRGFPIYTVAEQWEAANVQPFEGDSLVRLAGFKLVADGSNQGFTGLQREPYLGTESRGLAYTSLEDLKKLAATWAGRGWRLALHANGDAAIDNVLDALDHLRKEGIDLAEVRPRIEHCSILHDEQIARMKDLGVSASFLIGHVHYWGIALRDRVLGPERAALLGRCASVERAGVGYTIHSDFTVSDPEPLNMMQMAVTRRTWEDPAFVLNPDERVGVESAIRALTSEAAWQLGSEHEVGSIEPGKFADLVILDRDPRSGDPEKLGEIKVVETWFSGQRIHGA